MALEDFKFDTRWFKDIPQEEVDSFKQQLVSDKNTLDKLCKIVYNIVRSEQNIKNADYDSPSWACKQAHKNGKVEALYTVLALACLDRNAPQYEQA